MRYKLIKLIIQNKKFTTFINKNILLPFPFGVYILVNNKKQTIGHILLLSDDQLAGKETKLNGPWIAGVMIYKKYRNRGFGLLMIKQLEQILINNSYFNRVNLFTNNEIAKRLYKRAGFKKTKFKIKRHGKEYYIFFKKLDKF